MEILRLKKSTTYTVKPFDKYVVSGINDKGKLSDVVLSTTVLPNGMTLYGQRFSINEIPGADVLIGMDIISRGDCVITTAKGKTSFSFVISALNNKISFLHRTNIFNSRCCMSMYNIGGGVYYFRIKIMNVEMAET